MGEFKFVMMDSRDGETFKDISSRTKRTIPKGHGFYQLTKKEDVSADKVMVMYDGDEEFITESKIIREKLSAPSKGAFKINPDDVPEGWMLFIQSTSPNRKLVNGNVLIKLIVEREQQEDNEGDGEDIKTEKLAAEENNEEEEEITISSVSTKQKGKKAAKASTKLLVDEDEEIDDSNSGRKSKSNKNNKEEQKYEKEKMKKEEKHGNFEFILLDSKDGETFKDISKRTGKEFPKGFGFYQLTKKEDVSADKLMVLYDGDEEFVSDSGSIRERLKVNAKGAIKVDPGLVPEGWMLFIQSTSPNRKLAAGNILLKIERSQEKKEDDTKETKRVKLDDQEEEDDDN